MGDSEIKDPTRNPRPDLEPTTITPPRRPNSEDRPDDDKTRDDDK